MQLEPDTPEVRKKFNQLAREQLKKKLLVDIIFDIHVCQLEGWDYKEYLIDLCNTINHFIKEKK